MTIRERVEDIVMRCMNDEEINGKTPASIEKMIKIAYFMGREAATKELSDKFTDLLSAQHERAAQCRYKRMAEAIVGPETYIYSPYYRQDMTSLFGGDPADI